MKSFTLYSLILETYNKRESQGIRPFLSLCIFCFEVWPHVLCIVYSVSEGEFKEFETRLKYGWFHWKMDSMFQDLSRRSIETGFWRIWDAAQIH